MHYGPESIYEYPAAATSQGKSELLTVASGGHIEVPKSASPPIPPTQTHQPPIPTKAGSSIVPS